MTTTYHPENGKTAGQRKTGRRTPAELLADALAAQFTDAITKARTAREAFREQGNSYLHGGERPEYARHAYELELRLGILLDELAFREIGTAAGSV